MKEQAEAIIMAMINQLFIKTVLPRGFMEKYSEEILAFAKEKAEKFAKHLDKSLLSEYKYAEPWYLEDFKNWWEQKEKEL